MLQGDPTYLIVNDEGSLENFGVNAVCTHLGCVVPWVGVSVREEGRAVKQLSCGRQDMGQL
jgi:Rieske Fe-S protein